MLLSVNRGYTINTMENDLMTIQMTPEEYAYYRNCKKIADDSRELVKQKDSMIESLRNQYHEEFILRQGWAARAVRAESKLEKLSSIAESDMKTKLKLDNMIYELEDIKDR